MPSWIEGFWIEGFQFHRWPLLVHDLLLLLVLTFAVCVTLAAVLGRLPTTGRLRPVITTVLILWLPLEKMLLLLSLGAEPGYDVVRALAFGFAPVAANLSVLVMIWPWVYGSLQRSDPR